MFVSSRFYFHMLYRGWVDYLLIEIPVSIWELYDLKVEAKNQHNKNKFSTNREGVISFAVFLLSFFVGTRRRAVSGVGCRSPPANLDFQQKIQIGGKNMEGNRPKRRKDKYNPYTIFEKDGQYYVSFKDGQGVSHKLEISKVLYDTFDSFELSDLVYLNVVDRHIEQSEVWEATLNVRAVKKPEGIEEVVLKKIQAETLHTAMKKLPEMQRRRMRMYYFEDMTYEQIARKEGCTKMPVKRSIEAGIERLKKELKKI